MEQDLLGISKRHLCGENYMNQIANTQNIPWLIDGVGVATNISLVCNALCKLNIILILLNNTK